MSDERERQLKNGVPLSRGAGRSDCVICTKQDPKDRPGLEILHVIEGLECWPERHSVGIDLIFVVRNATGTAARFRLVHRGRVDGVLQRFSFDTTDPSQFLLADLYHKARRLYPNPDGSQTVLFHKKANCFGAEKDPITVSLSGPGGCFTDGRTKIELRPEFDNTYRVFSSFLIPPRSYREIADGEQVIFSIKLAMASTSYDDFVGTGERFVVDSYQELKREIELYDLPTATPEENDFYNQFIHPQEATICPGAYDIVILQRPECPVEVVSGSSRIAPMTPPNKDLRDRLLWFSGTPREFYLILRYADAIKGSRSQPDAVVSR